ncbi:MAG: hypothetical protein MUF33_13245 [Candidatus Nanopelagicales bacterium]|jgi:hypothetical protein|nr:hypothetical protein [Candidatus Nanopelagicales bacterium]MCU0296630.1 hypothetical protein [Candidatus Nanopelagicales bacterium]MCU0299467.1 hypothetical protein [Candidatus Nanopelagicales bacterium]
MRRSGFPWGFSVGVVVAAIVAVIISLIPGSVFIDPVGYVLLLVAVVVAGPPTVWMLRAVAATRKVEPISAVVGGMSGALIFDGLALSYVPGLYGQTGDALTAVATMLLVAFAAIGISAYLLGALNPQPDQVDA